MGLIAPPTYIAPPAIEPHRFGLYSIANTPDPTGRWELGVEWEPIAGERAELRASECATDYTEDVEVRAGETTLEGIPFLVVGSYSCYSASRPIEEAEERARLHLSAGEERAVELAITTGAMGNEPTFQGADDLTPTPGTAVDVMTGVRLLERAHAIASGSVGAIHVPRVLGAYADYEGFLMRQGQHIETLLGSYVAFGGGYDIANVGPDGTTPDDDEYWIYGTARPTVRRGDVFTQPDPDHYLNKDDNDVVILAQRTVLVTWNGPTNAVLVTAS